MNSHNLKIENIDLQSRKPFLCKLTGFVAILAALVFASTMNFRLQDSEDLGYHIAYGDQILKTGKIVDTNPFIYTLNAHHNDTPGPGGYWDDAGNFRFHNANWLSQVVISWFNRNWGMSGLSVLSGLLGTILFLLIAGCLYRLKITGALGALAILLIAISAGERLYLRPELFTYVLLIGQIFLLIPAIVNDKKMSWLTIGALTFLQIILVNVHSYFLLTIFIVGIIAFDKLMRYLWFAKQADDTFALDFKAQFKRAAIALGALVVACFINPFTYHMPYMPIETLVYFKKHNITSPPVDSSAHPMSEIGEFYPPFAIPYEYWAIGMKFYFAALMVAIVGIIAALVKRKWSAGLILMLMAMVSLSMRRNIAVACMVLVPISLWTISLLFKNYLDSRLQGKKYQALSVSTSIIILLVSSFLVINTFNSKIFLFADSDDRFGLGISKSEMPISAAIWIDKYNPAGKLWCDYNSSSNIHYLTRPHRSVPVLTNTWAYPHSIMKENIDQTRCEAGCYFDKDIADKYDVGIVLLRTGEATKRLLTKLSQSSDWAIVDIAPRFVLFVRNLPANQTLIAKHAITHKNFDTQKFINQILKDEPANPAQTLTFAASTLAEICFADQAIILYKKALEYSPSFAEAYHGLSFEYANLVRVYYTTAEKLSKTQYLEAVKYYKLADKYCKLAIEAGEKFLQLKPNAKKGIELLNALRKDQMLIPVAE